MRKAPSYSSVTSLTLLSSLDAPLHIYLSFWRLLIGLENQIFIYWPFVVNYLWGFCLFIFTVILKSKQKQPQLCITPVTILAVWQSLWVSVSSSTKTKKIKIFILQDCCEDEGLKYVKDLKSTRNEHVDQQMCLYFIMIVVIISPSRGYSSF